MAYNGITWLEETRRKMNQLVFGIKKNEGLSESIFNDASDIDKRKESFRKMHTKASTANEDVMRRFYDIKENKNKPVRIDEITLDKILTKHGNNGMINISAHRSDMPQEYNDEKTRELISDLKNSGYSYLPTYGGYRNPSNGIEDNYEPSFIVFNYTADGEPCDFEDLKKYGITLCKRYAQDSVLIKAPKEAPIYVDSDGNKVNDRESDKYWKNDPSKKFFTSLKSKEDVDDEIFTKLWTKYKWACRDKGIAPTKDGFENYYRDNAGKIDKIWKRYTYDIEFDECYVNPMPCQLNERMRRNGEVMVWEFIGVHEKPSSYEVINEARGFSDGMKKNGLHFICSNKKNTLILSEGIDWDVPTGEKGGIVVFSTDVNAVDLDNNKFINFFKQKIATIINRFRATSKIDKIANKNDLVGWTIGHHLDGRYKAKNGQNYGENSLSVEIIGVSYDRLVAIAEDLCRAFRQESVLCKSWDNGKVLFVNPK